MTVYEVDEDGNLNRLVETETRGIGDHDKIEVGDLTIRPLTQGRYTTTCWWVATEYEVDRDEQVEFSATGDSDVTRGEDATITIDITNGYDSPVVGSVTAEFCAPGPFGRSSCITEQQDVTLDGAEQTSVLFTVNTSRVFGNVTVTPAMTGTVDGPTGWTGVNWDCDRDSVIERIDDCTEVDLGTAEGDSIQAQVGEPEPEVPGNTELDRRVIGAFIGLWNWLTTLL
ncbi:hypothetical protein [Halorarum salinum]|uniref:Uncharacterized protein n=1 Tax=Halorarum salinum TaxID=2743089 RepID=A0A7D5LBG9_9EURY|nr:hypothetical protein [Halobaculum salinum]QLG62009.1 hypothetical protein HUG12_09850 [Halobaculum salinum]